MPKKCFKCGKEKDITEFYPHPRMKDGTLNKCKDCTRFDVTMSRQVDIEKKRDYDRRRGRTKKRIKENQHYTKERRKREPWKYKAYLRVKRGLASGKIVKTPCSVCGSIAVEGHHEDYTKPLDVIWLCKIHHEEIHKTKGDFKVNSKEGITQ